MKIPVAICGPKLAATKPPSAANIKPLLKKPLIPDVTESAKPDSKLFLSLAEDIPSIFSLSFCFLASAFSLRAASFAFIWSRKEPSRTPSPSLSLCFAFSGTAIRSSKIIRIDSSLSTVAACASISNSSASVPLDLPRNLFHKPLPAPVTRLNPPLIKLPANRRVALVAL